MKDGFFLQELKFDFTYQTISNEILELIEKIGVDTVHCSGQLPAVFMKEVTSFDNNALNEIAEIQRKIWNESSVIFLYVTSPTEIRIYNCNATPVLLNRAININEELQQLEIENCHKSDVNKLHIIKQIFSSTAIDSGLIWTHEYSKKIKLQTKVDHYLVESLLNLAEKLNKDIKNHDIIHSLLMRSIFIMYLQDRKAIPKEIWDKIGEYDFLKILDDPQKTYLLFEEIERHFNGNVFPIKPNEKDTVKSSHLDLLRRCLIDGNIDTLQNNLFPNWRLFNFSFIRIELLSEIYENFLNRFDSVRKKNTGTYYTPPSLVELVLNEVLPKKGFNYNQKVLDPACGSGIFLAQAYKRIVQYWINDHPKKELTFSVLSQLMQNNIFGIECDRKSIRVAAFSLYLALIDFLDPKNVWLKNGDEFPYLIFDAESKDNKDKVGRNLFRTDTISHDGEFEKIEYDIIIGNPPFGTDNLPDNVKVYCENLKFSKQYVIPFIHKSTILAPNGEIALLFNTKLLTNNQKPAQNFRKWLFKDCYVKKIHNLSILRKAPKQFGGQLFSSATTPVSIVYFKKEFPKELSPTIEYWAPKTFIRNHVVEGVLVDNSDIKFLPREICQQPNSKIWKIAQWGTMGDYFLIEKLTKNNKSFFLDYLDSHEIMHKVGFQPLAKSKAIPKHNSELSNFGFIDAKNIERYYTSSLNKQQINSCIKSKKAKEFYLKYYNVSKVSELPQIDVFRREGKIELYNSPHVLVKEGQSRNLFCSSFIDFPCTFTSTILGIKGKDEEKLKAIVGYLNSRFSSYFLFLTSSSWGIERERIKPNELYNLPSIPDSLDVVKISTIIDSIIQKKQDNFLCIDNIYSEINEIEDAIMCSFNMLEKDRVLINDIVNIAMDLFNNGSKSVALKSIDSQNPETESYAQMLSNEMNGFLVYGDLKVNSRVYKVSSYTPLCLVAIQFVHSPKVTKPRIINSEKQFRDILKIINEHTIKEYSQNIYIRKQIKYYDYADDTILIIKPNQKRFWTRSQGIEDAHSIINEIAVRKDERAD